MHRPDVIFGSEDPVLPEEARLSAAIDAMAPAGVRMACRALRDGDEAYLLPMEAASITTRIEARRRASGAARFAARKLLTEFGFGEAPIFRGVAGEPIWPEGIVGSLAHDDEMAIAAIGRIGPIISIGVDVEPCLPLPQDIADLVVTPEDIPGEIGGATAGRLVFTAKEAVYKAVYRLEREILDYDDISVDLPAGRAVTRSGRSIRLFHCLAPRLVTLAVIEAGQQVPDQPASRRVMR